MSATMTCCRLWTEAPLLVIDVETTGVGHLDRIVEIGLARFERGEAVARWTSLVNPGRPIPTEATKIHGIDDADVYHAPPFNLIVHEILRLGHGAYPVAYNTTFDKRFLLQEIRRTRLDLRSTPPFDPTMTWIDPFAWVRAKSAPSATNTLAAACARNGVALDTAHRAAGDALATGRLLYALADCIGPMTVCELLRRQLVYTESFRADMQAWQTNAGLIE